MRFVRSLERGLGGGLGLLEAQHDVETRGHGRVGLMDLDRGDARRRGGDHVQRSAEHAGGGPQHPVRRIRQERGRLFGRRQEDALGRFDRPGGLQWDESLHLGGCHQRLLRGEGRAAGGRCWGGWCRRELRDEFLE